MILPINPSTPVLCPKQMLIQEGMGALLKKKGFFREWRAPSLRYNQNIWVVLSVGALIGYSIYWVFKRYLRPARADEKQDPLNPTLIGVGQNFEQVFEWYKAADQGDAVAQYNLGVCYNLAHGIEQNFEQAVYWYTKAAHQGLAEAQNNLGVCYAFGHGIGKNFKQAVHWYKKAADQGHAEAQHNLGICYYLGHGIGQNFEQAFEWYTKAAHQGYAKAQYDLGVCYEFGHGIGQNFEQAFEWYTKAADQGDAVAQQALERLSSQSKGFDSTREELSNLRGTFSIMLR
jgi:TPR repeat protein